VYYADKISSIDSTLPNARLVSNKLFATPPFSYNAARVAFMAAAWGEKTGAIG